MLSTHITLDLQTKVHEDFTIMEKASTRAFSYYWAFYWLKRPLALSHWRHYADTMIWKLRRLQRFLKLPIGYGICASVATRCLYCLNSVLNVKVLVGACNYYEHCENFTEVRWQLYYTLLPPVPRQKVVRSRWLPTPGHGDNDDMAAAWPQTPVISSGAYNHPCTCHYPQHRNITTPAH